MVLRYFALAFVAAILNPLFGSGTVLACDELVNPRLALHIEAPTSKRACGQTQLACPNEIVTTGELHQLYKVYVVLLDWNNIAMRQIQFGIDYDAAESTGVDVLSFESCASTSVPIGDWPNPGSQLLQTYSTCQVITSNEAFVLGWFWVTAETPGSLSIGPLNLWEGNAGTVCRFWNCSLEEKILNPARYGKIGLGGAPSLGCGFIDIFPAPCCTPDSCIASSGLGCCWVEQGTLLDYTSSCAACITPMLPNTWGRLKSRYN